MCIVVILPVGMVNMSILWNTSKTLHASITCQDTALTESHIVQVNIFSYYWWWQIENKIHWCSFFDLL